MKLRFIVSILLSFLTTHTLLGDEKSVALAGCRDNFERLRTGACRIELIIDGGDPIEIKTWFDLDAGAFRFDRLVPDKDGIAQGGRIIYTKDKTYERLGMRAAGRAVVRGTSSADCHPTISFFDARKLGTFSIPGPSYTFNDRLIVDSVSNNKDVQVEVFGHLTKLSWEQDERRKQLWLDEKQGYGWVKNVTESDLTKLDFETSWKEKGGVFVASDMKFVNRQLDITEIVTATVSWEIVNGPIDPFLFTPEALAGDDQISMYSNELGGSPVFVEALGEESSAGQGAPSIKTNGSFRLSIIVLIVMLSVVSALLWRRRTRKD
ncbi:MAG: hypothetical protein MUC43_09975 [Pirellula sp.]|jgi:hypothetical protein|nr:hypothetical protein [Pirellula sp.]